MALATLIFASAAQAQDPGSRNELRFTTGFAGFIDEATDHHAVLGASYRRYLTRRFSIEPEFSYLIGSGSDRNITIIPNVSYDFRPGQAVRPYLTAGVGLLHQRTRFPTTGLYTYNEATVSGGVGVKVFVRRGLFLAPEFRFGHEPLFRATGSFGFVF